jgi:POT family proton-dependent oligopeptide transporter
MMFFSFGLPMPENEMVNGEPVAKHVADVTPNLLIATYLILTFGELLLSPMGISFVSKVAPPKYKGMMMGGWFVATAIGNQLVLVGGLLWGDLPLTLVWGVFIAVCLVAALFMFAMMKRLEKVA